MARAWSTSKEQATVEMKSQVKLVSWSQILTSFKLNNTRYVLFKSIVYMYSWTQMTRKQRTEITIVVLLRITSNPKQKYVKHLDVDASHR